MQNVKPTIYSALLTASALSTLKAIEYQYPSSFVSLPRLSYFIIDNIGNLFADDVEIGSEILSQIDLWGSDLSAYADAVNDIMTGLGYTRIGCADLYDTGIKSNHKAMRFRIDISDPTF